MLSFDIMTTMMMIIIMIMIIKTNLITTKQLYKNHMLMFVDERRATFLL